tara:strand:+ start:1308 stop:1886 length:579 start_codon:yes stop_codon:yes gene_type:complete
VLTLGHQKLKKLKGNMGSTKTFHALYNDDDVLLSAVKKIKKKHYDIEEIYTPFPVHGLDKVMGLEPTRIAIAAFIYGCIGIAVATLMMNYIMIVDWPQNIGGKPSFSYLENMPAFVPIMFEMTVFHAAHLMVITFYLRSRMWPLKEAENPDPRTTDDHFLIEIITDKPVAALKKLLKDSGAVEINEVKSKDH